MLILSPYKVGETATLVAARELSCTVTDPAGATTLIDTPYKRVEIPLTMVGTYRYKFSDGTVGDITVVDAPAPLAAP